MIVTIVGRDAVDAEAATDECGGSRTAKACGPDVALLLAMTAQVLRNPTLVRVPRGQIARDFRAFLDIAADRDRGRGRAGPVGLLEAVIAAVEAGDHAGAAVAGGGFGVDQRLHLVAPFRAFIGAADAAQIVQRAEDFGQPLQIAVERRGGILGPRGSRDCRPRSG